MTLNCYVLSKRSSLPRNQVLRFTHFFFHLHKESRTFCRLQSTRCHSTFLWLPSVPNLKLLASSSNLVSTNDAECLSQMETLVVVAFRWWRLQKSRNSLVLPVCMDFPLSCHRGLAVVFSRYLYQRRIGCVQLKKNRGRYHQKLPREASDTASASAGNAYTP